MTSCLLALFDGGRAHVEHNQRREGEMSHGAEQREIEHEARRVAGAALVAETLIMLRKSASAPSGSSRGGNRG